MDLWPDAVRLDWLDAEEIEGLLNSQTNVYRMGWGDSLSVDRFGPAVLVSSPGSEPDQSLMEEICGRWDRHCAEPIRAIFFRQLVRNPGSANLPVCVAGGPDTSYHVSEHGMNYRVDFSWGYSCGFFADQRENRRFLKKLSLGAVLNTFAFTCAFSVVAAASGARTLSIDLSKAALGRGRENFALNGLPTDGHRFIADDVFAVLPRLVRRSEQFDVVIVDPPTFSRSRNRRVWRVEDGLPYLLDLALACTRPEGWVLLSTNSSSLSVDDLQHIAASRPVRQVECLAPPADYRAGPGGSRALWIQRA